MLLFVLGRHVNTLSLLFCIACFFYVTKQYITSTLLSYVAY